MIAYKFFLIFIVSTAFSLVLISQETKMTPAQLAKMDTSFQAWMRERHQAAILKRDAFFKVFNQADPDTITQLSFSGMDLETLPDLEKYNRVTRINLSDNQV